MNFDFLKKDRWIIASIGGLQGFTLWMVHVIWPESPFLQTWAISGMTLVMVASLITQFAWTGQNPVRLTAVAVTLGFLFALCSFWIFREASVKDVLYKGQQLRIGTWIMGASVALFVIEPFIQIFQQNGKPRFPYKLLFFHSWGNFPIAALGFIYMGVFWGLTLLWGGLFKIIKIVFFWDLFTSPEFQLLTLPVFFAFGLAYGKETARVIDTARGTTLSVFRFLIPLLSLISLLFLLALPFKGLELLWATDMATPLLLTLIGLMILFLNGLFEDGEKEPPFRPWLHLGIEGAVLAMPVFSAIAWYSLNLRIEQYGLTPPRFFGMVFVIVTGCYALGYAVAVLRRGGTWMGFIRPVNLVLAWVVVTIALALHTPILDPLGWSARSQLDRLMTGKGDPKMFDFGYLRFRLGRQGWETLQRMEEINDHPAIETIRTGINKARKMDYYKQPKNILLTKEDFVLVGGLGQIPEGFLPFLEEEVHFYRQIKCQTSEKCYLFSVELDGAEPPEICVGLEIDYRGINCFANSKEGWKKLGRLQIEDGHEVHELEVKSSRIEQIKTVPSKYQDVQIDGKLYIFQMER